MSRPQGHVADGWCDDPNCTCDPNARTHFPERRKEPLAIARVRAPWWRRVLAWWRTRRGVQYQTVRVAIPKYAGGGHVVLRSEAPHVLVRDEGYTRPVATEMPGELERFSQ